VKDRNDTHARIRHTATGAVAALVAAGAIAGAVALAAGPNAKTQGQATVPDKTQAPRPAVDHQPFLNAVQQLVSDGTITAAEGQAVDREVVAGRVDTATLRGFTPAQLQAVQEALGNAKMAVAASMGRPASGATK